MNTWSNLWLPRILGCFLLADWTMASTSSRTLRPIVTSADLVAAGSFLAEYRMSTFLPLLPKVVVEAVKNPRFAQQLEAASPMVKFLLVMKLVPALGGRRDFVKYMPDALAPYVPQYELAFGYKFDTQDLNSKPWLSEQAAVFFDDLIRRDVDFNSLSPFILSGFTCAVASSLSAERFRQLAKAMKLKNVPLKEEQLSCLENSLMFHGLASQFEDFPPELFLFSGPAAYPNCKKHFANIGREDADILKKTSAQRKRLLKLALLCWQISDQQISLEHADSLGLLACELDSNYIRTSGKNLLRQLNKCHSFTEDQITAIRALLVSGGTFLGPPSQWTGSHLLRLNGFIYFFGQGILSRIPGGILIPWLKTFIQDSQLPREKLVPLIENFHRAYKRESVSGCPGSKTITEAVAKGKLMPMDYTPVELRACLTPEVLKKYLHFMSQQAFTKEQTAVIKEKLDEMYPRVYPDSVLYNLGGLLQGMTPDDVQKWTITSIDMLNSLLANQPPDTLASTIIKKYTDYEKFLESYSVFAIGTRYICLLDANQLGFVDEESIRLSVSLDPSRCSQATKDALYPKAKYAFFHQQSDLADYYNLMKPYLGGAPGEDLITLHSYNINMDIGTFQNLRQSALMKLTISDVKGLLGVNVKDLKKNQDKTPIKEWIQTQNPEELNKIDSGLTGDLPERLHHTTITPLDSAAARPFVSSSPALYLFHVFLLTLLLHFFLL